MRQTALGEEPLKGLHSNCNGYLGPEGICISVEWGPPLIKDQTESQTQTQTFPLTNAVNRLLKMRKAFSKMQHCR